MKYRFIFLDGKRLILEFKDDTEALKKAVEGLEGYRDVLAVWRLDENLSREKLIF